MLASGSNRHEMIAGELSDLAGETDAAIGEQDLRLAEATRVQQKLAGQRIARGVFITQTEVELTKRNPARLAAPPHMNQALPGNMVANLAQVRGAAERSRRAVNTNGPAVMRTSAMTRTLSHFSQQQRSQAIGRL